MYAPLLRWCVDHGAVITAVHRTIYYTPCKIFEWFVWQVTQAHRTGDVEKSKALLAEVLKLLGNSGYGKLIEALERQTDVFYTKDEKVVDRALRSSYFSDLDEVGEAYGLESFKPRITIRRPFQVGIAVYQLAKLRMLEFYYDFLDRYFDRKDFELIQMDTESNYIAISAEKLEDVVKPELQKEFEENKKKWSAWDKWSGRTPGLFKLECEGSRMITLCSKCYFVERIESEKNKLETTFEKIQKELELLRTKGISKKENNKLSTKGMSKKQNEINWQRFKSALAGNKDMATNMVTYL